jgi:hypothetical protein
VNVGEFVKIDENTFTLSSAVLRFRDGERATMALNA